MRRSLHYAKIPHCGIWRYAMTRDLKQLLEEAARPPRRGPDMNAIRDRARTITWQRRLAAGGLAIALLAGGFAAGRAGNDRLFGAADNQIASPDDGPSPDEDTQPNPEPSVPPAPRE